MRRSPVATALVAVLISYVGAPAAVKTGGFIQTNLVSDQLGVAPALDPNLVNAWGITRSTTSPFWVSDNGAGVSTLYAVSQAGVATPQRLVVSIPTCDDPLGRSGTPTGVVFNIDGGANGGFKISGVDSNNHATSSAAVFLFVTEDGTIVGWNPEVNPPGFDKTKAGTYGIIAAPDCPLVGSIARYKGLAIATTPSGTFLYATNFNSGVVEVYNDSFVAQTPLTDPNLPAAFAPFNVAVLNGKVYVTFAIRNPATGDNVPGHGSGIVDVFNLDGTFNQRLAHGGQLKAPWGMEIAPANFGATLAGKLWIGNFGDGQINVFDPDSGAFIDTVRDTNGNPIVIDGLWGLMVGSGSPRGGRADTIYFTAGPNKEQHGLFGSLFPSP